MIGLPMPKPRDLIIDNLNRQMEAFFGSGNKAQEIAPGVSDEVGVPIKSTRSNKLRVERDKIAPKLKQSVDSGASLHQAGRSRFRGLYSTHSLADFSTYVADRAATAAKSFIDQDEMTCTLLFNLGIDEQPGHADDRAVLKLKASAGYNAAQSIGGRGYVSERA